MIKQRDVEMDQQSLLFQVSYPETTENMSHNCFMFSQEQRMADHGAKPQETRVWPGDWLRTSPKPAATFRLSSLSSSLT